MIQARVDSMITSQIDPDRLRNLNSDGVSMRQREPGRSFRVMNDNVFRSENMRNERKIPQFDSSCEIIEFLFGLIRMYQSISYEFTRPCKTDF